MKPTLVLASFLAVVFSHFASARGYSGWENQAMIANGQGVSSPSFWEGLKSQNPAGLAQNQRLKFQAATATFDDTTHNLRGSAALLGGEGPVGFGLEYSQFDSVPYAPSTHDISGGLALRLDAIHTDFGITGHFVNGSSGSYNFGFLFDPGHRVRFGLMGTGVQNGFHDLGAGLTFEIDPAIDLVVDSSYNLSSKDSVVKPGITLHAARFEISAAYGFNAHGTSEPLLYTKFSAAIGIELADHVLLEYSYRGLPQHMLGLTIR